MRRLAASALGGGGVLTAVLGAGRVEVALIAMAFTITVLAFCWLLSRDERTARLNTIIKTWRTSKQQPESGAAGSDEPDAPGTPRSCSVSSVPTTPARWPRHVWRVLRRRLSPARSSSKPRRTRIK
jgi:hypothetical protein